MMNKRIKLNGVEFRKRAEQRKKVITRITKTQQLFLYQS